MNNVVTAADGFRVVSLGLGVLSILFSLLSLRAFLKRLPPRQVRQHVGRVTWTYVAFVSFSLADTAVHWGSPFRWQLFACTVVFLMAINAQAPLLAYESKARKFGDGPAPAAGPALTPAYQTTVTTTAVLVILAVVVLGVGVRLLPTELKSPAFDPLELSLQHVTSRVDGVTGPAIHLGDELKVDAVKCNKSGMAIGIRGQTRWVSADPGGTIVDGSAGSGIRPAMPRCPEFHFSNKLPDAVVARTQELFDEGREFVSWTYTGVETPLGLRGVQRGWSTEVFRIVR